MTGKHLPDLQHFRILYYRLERLSKTLKKVWSFYEKQRSCHKTMEIISAFLECSKYKIPIKSVRHTPIAVLSLRFYGTLETYNYLDIKKYSIAYFLATMFFFLDKATVSILCVCHRKAFLMRQTCLGCLDFGKNKTDKRMRILLCCIRKTLVWKP